MNSDTIGAGIVTFNPDIGRLKENIDAILPQVSELVIVDNGSANVDEVCDMIESYGSIYMVWNEENQGIAKALNQIVEFADSHKWQWVLTLDQDSVVMAGLIDNYRKYMDFDKTAMITCLFLDRNYGIQQEYEFSEEYRYAERCITSGCLTKVAACLETGGLMKTCLSIMLILTCATCLGREAIRYCRAVSAEYCMSWAIQSVRYS